MIPARARLRAARRAVRRKPGAELLLDWADPGNPMNRRDAERLFPGSTGMAGTEIPDWQRTVHVVTEAASVAMVPWVFAAAAQAREPHRSRLRFLGWGMLVVDGLLLLRWLSTPRR